MARKKKKTARKPKSVDSTNVEFSDELVDHVFPEESGYNEDEAAMYDNSDALAGIGAREFPSALWIEPREWQERAKQNDETKTWPDNYRNRFTHQGNSHECTCHALAQNMEIAWNRQSLTKEFAVWFSPLSVYAEANPRRWGGSYMQKTVGICINRGILPSYNGPDGIRTQANEFKHTLNETAGNDNSDNGGGDWVPLSRFPSGWRETARHFKAAEVINPRSAE